MALHMPYPMDSEMSYGQYYGYGQEEGYATGYDFSGWGSTGADSAFDDPAATMAGMSSLGGMDAFGLDASFAPFSAFGCSDDAAGLLGDGGAGAQDYSGLTLGELPAGSEDPWALGGGLTAAAAAASAAGHGGPSQFMMAAALAKVVAGQRQRQQAQQKLLQQQQEAVAKAASTLKPSPALAAAALKAAGGALPPGETLRLAAAGFSVPKASPFAPTSRAPAKLPTPGVATAASGAAASLGSSGGGRGLGGGLRAMTGPMAAAVAKVAASAATQQGSAGRSSSGTASASAAATVESKGEGNSTELPWQIARQVPAEERGKLLMVTLASSQKSRFPGPELMWEHFSQFGEVSKVLIANSSDSNQQQPTSPKCRHMAAYVVLADSAALELAKAHGEEHVIGQSRVEVHPLRQAEKAPSSQTFLPPGLEMFASAGKLKQLQSLPESQTTHSSPRTAGGGAASSEEASSTAADDEGRSSGSTTAEPAAEPAPASGSSEGGGEDAALL